MYVLCFLLKVRRESVSLMSAGRASHARGPGTENALSVTRSLVRRTFNKVRQNEAECHHNDRTVLRGIVMRFTVLNVERQSAELELYLA